jgi:hypothetical protein
MYVDLNQLRTLITKHSDAIDQSVAGTGYLARTVIGVATYLLDNEGDLELLTARQRATFDRFLAPLMQETPR